jgi:hypothetical protein
MVYLFLTDVNKVELDSTFPTKNLLSYGFDVLLAVTTKTVDFWSLTPYSLSYTESGL